MLKVKFSIYSDKSNWAVIQCEKITKFDEKFAQSCPETYSQQMKKADLEISAFCLNKYTD